MIRGCIAVLVDLGSADPTRCRCRLARYRAAVCDELVERLYYHCTRYKGSDRGQEVKELYAIAGASIECECGHKLSGDVRGYYREGDLGLGQAEDALIRTQILVVHGIQLMQRL
jgi:hypothetical protein